MKKLSNTEAELKESVAYKKSEYLLCRIIKLFIKKSRCLFGELNQFKQSSNLY